MSIKLLRSPYYFVYTDAVAVSLKLEISIDGTLRYTLVKNFDANDKVVFEYAELIRDYIDIDVTDPNTWSVKAESTLSTYDGLNGTGTQLFTFSFDALGTEGYEYVEPQESALVFSSPVLQTNRIIYKLDDEGVTLPVDRNEATKVTYLYQGEVVREDAITTSTDYAITLAGADWDNYTKRIEDDLGTFEDSICLTQFYNSYTLVGVDTIYVDSSDGTEVIDVINISECKYKPIKLKFANRYGAIQDVWFFKKSIESVNVKSDTYNRFNISYGSYDKTKHQIKEYNKQSSQAIKLNTGYVDESYNDVMQELLQSELVWMVNENNDNIPVNVKTSSLTFKTSVNDKLVDYSIDIEYSFNVIDTVR